MKYKVAFLLFAMAAGSSGQTPDKSKLSGPYQHENLTVFLVHRSDVASTNRPGQIKYLTLRSAIQQDKVKVYETGQVNGVAIENTSLDTVFIQRGEIVKGGRQDRMISKDFILPAKSGRVPIDVYCVEQNRWRPRGNESASTFSESTELAAVRFDLMSMWGQTSVWDLVSKIQGGLSSRVRNERVSGLAAAVAPPVSPSSLALTQASPPVEQATAAYRTSLSGIIRDKPGVVGYVFAVNGELRSADVYSSPSLFAEMWPKLLKSSIIDSVRVAPQHKPVSVSQATAFLHSADAGKETVTGVDRRTRLAVREAEKSVLLESRDGADWVHRAVLKK